MHSSTSVSRLSCRALLALSALLMSCGSHTEAGSGGEPKPTELDGQTTSTAQVHESAAPAPGPVEAASDAMHEFPRTLTATVDATQSHPSVDVTEPRFELSGEPEIIVGGFTIGSDFALSPDGGKQPPPDGHAYLLASWKLSVKEGAPIEETKVGTFTRRMVKDLMVGKFQLTQSDGTVVPPQGPWRTDAGQGWMAGVQHSLSADARDTDSKWLFVVDPGQLDGASIEFLGVNYTLHAEE